MKQLNIIILCSVITAMLIGCQSNQEELTTNAYTAEEFSLLSAVVNLPEVPYSYSVGNLNSEEKVNHKGALGRVLFYDKNLSSDATVSCGSCHQQALAFADDQSFSHGVNGNVTKRNSIALGSFRNFGRHYNQSINEEFTPGLFWDERAESIAEQLRQTIKNPNEMGMDLDQIVALVESRDYYRVLHQKAFNTDEVKEDHILEALEVFINSIESRNPKYETELLNELNFITGDSVVGTSGVELGAQLFANNCNSCHRVSSNFFETDLNTEPINAANNGLVLAQDDLGIFEHTQKSEDIGKFKVPGLLNIELTAPYMHDGRFASLEEVVEFYNSGVEFNPNLHPALRNGTTAKRLNLTEEEKTALVEFLELLTDEEITVNQQWSDPFVE